MGFSKMRCIVEGCQGRGGHVFPKNLKRKVAWLKAIKWSDSKDPHHTAIVCHQHFLETDYKNSLEDLQTFVEWGTLGKNRRLRLRRTAVPSVFPNENSHSRQIVTEQDGELLIEITDRTEDNRAHSNNEDNNCETIIVVGDSEAAVRDDDVLLIEEGTFTHEYPRNPLDLACDYQSDDDSHDDSPISDFAESVRNDLQKQDTTCHGELLFTHRASDPEGWAEDVHNEVTITEFSCNDDGIDIESIYTVPVIYTESGLYADIFEENSEPAEDGFQIFNEGEPIHDVNPDFNVSNGMEIISDEDTDLNPNVPTCETAKNPKAAFVTTFKMTKKYVSLKPNELMAESANPLRKMKSVQPLPKIKSTQPLPKITLTRQGVNGWVLDKKKVHSNKKRGNLLRRNLEKKKANISHKRRRRDKKVGAAESNGFFEPICETMKNTQVCGSTSQNGSLPDLLLHPEELPDLQNPCISARIPLKRVTDPDECTQPSVANLGNDKVDLSPLTAQAEQPTTQVEQPAKTDERSTATVERPTSPQYHCIDVSDDDSYSSVDSAANENRSSESSPASQSIEKTPNQNENPLSFIGKLKQSTKPSISTLSIKHQILHQVAMKVGTEAKQKIMEQLAKTVSSLSQPDFQNAPSTPNAATQSAGANIESKQKKIVKFEHPHLTKPNFKSRGKVNILKPKKALEKSNKDSNDPRINMPLLSKAYKNGEPLVVKWAQGIPSNAQFLGASGDKTFYMLEDVLFPRKDPTNEVPKSPPREIRKLVEEWGDSDEDEDYQMFVIPDSASKTIGDLPVASAAPREFNGVPINSTGDEDCVIVDKPLETIDLCDDEGNSKSKLDDEVDPTSSNIDLCMGNVVTSFQKKAGSKPAMKSACFTARNDFADHGGPPINDVDLVIKEMRKSFQSRNFTAPLRQHPPPPPSTSVSASISEVISKHSNSAAKIFIPPTKKVSNIIWRSVTSTARPSPGNLAELTFVRNTHPQARDCTVIAASEETLVGEPIVYRTPLPEPFPDPESNTAPDFGWMELPPTPATSPNYSPKKVLVENTTEEAISLNELLTETSDEITISPDGVIIASDERNLTVDSAPENSPAEHAALQCFNIAANPSEWQPPSLETLNPTEELCLNMAANEVALYAGHQEEIIHTVADHHQSSFLETLNPTEGSWSGMAMNEEPLTVELYDEPADAIEQPPISEILISTEGSGLDLGAVPAGAEPMPFAEFRYISLEQIQSSLTQFMRFPSSVSCSDETPNNVPSTTNLPLTEPPKHLVASYNHINDDHCYSSPYLEPLTDKRRIQTIKTLKSKNRPKKRKIEYDLELDALIGDAKSKTWAVSLKRLSPQELDKYLSPKKVVEHEVYENESDFGEVNQTCYHCGEDFPSLKSLKEHITLRHKYNQLICPHCFAGFLCAMECNEHIRNIHKLMASELTYACTQCDYTTNDHCALRGHIDVVHKVQRHKACPQCIFKCTSDETMEKHMDKYHSSKSHSGDYIVSNIQDLIGEEIMPLPIGVPVSDQTPVESIGAGKSLPSAEFNLESVFSNSRVEPEPDLMVPCPSCTSVFKNLAELGKHFVRVHQKYPCPICSKSVSNLSVLKAHMRTHMIPICPVCRGHFPSKNLLIRHVKDAHYENFLRMVWCKFCPFASEFESAVKLHFVVIHETTEFPVKCPVCESASTRNLKELLIHTARVHYQDHNQVTKM